MTREVQVSAIIQLL